MYFDIDAHRDCFKTNKDEAYFWHGQTNGCGGSKNAMDIASQNGGKTLEMCIQENRAELEKAGVKFKDHDDGTVSIDYGNTRDESKRFWGDCSKSFAEQSSGNVHVIEGTDLRPNGQYEKDYPSVYNRIERPTLEQNAKVTSLTIVNPSNGKTISVESVEKNANNHSFTQKGSYPNEFSSNTIETAEGKRFGALPELEDIGSPSNTLSKQSVGAQDSFSANLIDKLESGSPKVSQSSGIGV